MLSEENIDLSMLGLVKENTGTALINIFESSDNQIVYIPGANKSTSHKQVTTEFLEKALVVVSQMEVNSEEVDQLFRKSKSTKCINILNVAPYRKPSKTLVENTDFLVFNELEFSLFSGLENSMPLDIDTINGALKDQNFNNETAVIVTLGERGLVYLHNNHSLYIDHLVLSIYYFQVFQNLYLRGQDTLFPQIYQFLFDYFEFFYIV